MNTWSQLLLPYNFRNIPLDALQVSAVDGKYSISYTLLDPQLKIQIDYIDERDGSIQLANYYSNISDASLQYWDTAFGGELTGQPPI